MTSLTIVSTRTSKQVCLLGTAILFLAGFCFSQPAISLSPIDGPPTTSLRVAGSGFAPNAKIDIYFGTQGEAVAMTNGSGSFSQIAIRAPASALPGTHWVSAVERSGHSGTQATFLVHTSWNQFHRQDMVRWNRYENVLNVNNVGGLQRKWSYATGEGYVGSSPAVVNGVVYVSSGSGKAYALQASNGAKLWSYLTHDNLGSAPAVANGVVYLGSTDGNVYALKANTGALLWRYYTSDYGVGCSPTVVNGVVYIGADNDYVYALKATTGALLWSYLTTGFVLSTPAVANGVVYVGSDDGNLYALNASTGAMLWSYAIGSPTMSSPAVANGVVYMGPDNSDTVYALSASTGTVLWTYATTTNLGSSPAVANGVVYVGVFNSDAYALNAKTGALLWTYPGGFSSAAVANGVVYVGSYDGNVYALNASTGTKLWSYNTGYSVDSSPAVVNGVVYVGSNNGVVSAYGLKKDQEKEQAASERPSLKTLRPDFHLKVSQPVATPAGTQ